MKCDHAQSRILVLVVADCHVSKNRVLMCI